MDRNDYKLTFEDGSEAIAHHGVKGMKWGVWNEETKMRRLGRSRAKSSASKLMRGMSTSEKEQLRYAKETVKEITKAYEKGDWIGSNVRLTNEVHGRLSEARKKMNDSDPLGKKYYSDPKLQKKYKEKYADELSKRYDNTPEGRKSYRKGVLFDDLDQGSLSAFSFESSYDLYVKDNVKDPKAYFAKQHEAQEEYRTAVKAEVAKALGPYAEAPTRKNPDKTLSGRIYNEVYYQSLARDHEERNASRNYYDPWKDEEALKKH